MQRKLLFNIGNKLFKWGKSLGSLKRTSVLRKDATVEELSNNIADFWQ